MSSEMKALLDHIAQTRFSRRFSELNREEKAIVMQMADAELRRDPDDHDAHNPLIHGDECPLHDD